MVLNSQVLVETAVRAAGAKKAYDITVLDITKISIIADYFLICTGRSSTHVKGIAEEIEEVIEKETGFVPRREGWREARWVLLDYGDLVVHIFLEEERRFYNLERLWSDAGELKQADNVLK